MIVTSTEHHRALHESERYDTACDALAVIRAMRVRHGYRWMALACGVCRGWHVVEVRNA